MSVFTVSYDLHDPGRDYSDLHDAIKDYPGYAHILESTWLISISNSNASEIRDDLKPHVDYNDRLLVTQISESLGSSWATTFTDDHTDWLHNEL